MKLTTKTQVALNGGVSSPVKAIIEGKLIEDFGRIEEGSRTFRYIYSFTDGVIYKQGNFMITKEESDALFELIKSKLPNAMEIPYSEFELLKKYEGFKVEMSKALGTPVSNIEIVEEPTEEV